MGFWSTVGSLASGAADKMTEMSQEANILAEDYRKESDDYLKRKVTSGGPAQRLAAAKVLKERGFGS